MARKPVFTIKVDPIRDLADRVGQLDPEALAQTAVTTLNETIDSAYEMGRERITVGINLSDEYLRRRMRVAHATPNKLEASITASGGNADMTRLASYDATMVLVPRKTMRPSRSKGILGIPSGERQQGVNVSVTRGSSKTLESGFILPLRGTAGKVGVFRREGDKLRHLMGPSVYQLFAYQAGQMLDETTDELQKNLIAHVDAEVERILR